MIQTFKATRRRELKIQNKIEFFVEVIDDVVNIYLIVQFFHDVDLSENHQIV